VFVTDIEYPRTPSGVVVAESIELVKVRAGTRTVTVSAQAGSVGPAAQFAPTVEDVTVLFSRKSPGSGSRTTTEKLTVTLAPIARLPPQRSVDPE
jgi:hypothetical protein